jgi:hypothetical protein
MGLGSRRDEMAAAVPVVVPVAVHSPQIGLVHQRRRIQRLAGPFLRDLLRCQPPQLVVDQWRLPTEGRRSRGCRLCSTNQTAKRRNPVSAPIRREAGSPSPPKVFYALRTSRLARTDLAVSGARTARRVFESQTPSLAHANPVDVALEMISGSGRQFARGATRFLAPFHS